MCMGSKELQIKIFIKFILVVYLYSCMQMVRYKRLKKVKWFSKGKKITAGENFKALEILRALLHHRQNAPARIIHSFLNIILKLNLKKKKLFNWFFKHKKKKIRISVSNHFFKLIKLLTLTWLHILRSSWRFCNAPDSPLQTCGQLNCICCFSSTVFFVP